MRFLQNWLTQHILKTNLKFGRFLSSLDTPGKARAA